MFGKEINSVAILDLFYDPMDFQLHKLTSSNRIFNFRGQYIIL